MFFEQTPKMITGVVTGKLTNINTAFHPETMDKVKLWHSFNNAPENGHFNDVSYVSFLTYIRMEIIQMGATQLSFIKQWQ